MRAALCTLGLALLIAIELGAPTRDPFDSGSTPPRVIEATQAAHVEEKATLTRPADLLLLEMPDRAIWQRPDEIMDKLNIADSAWVADVGAGSGWFTIRLSQRVDPQKRGRGKVFAQDVQKEMLTAIDRRVRREGFRNVETVQGDNDSTRLPRHVLDAILVVDVYAEVTEGKRVAFLRDLSESLKPTGRIGIVNYKPGAGGPGPEEENRFPRSVVERDASEAKLQILSRMDLQYQYVVVLGK